MQAKLASGKQIVKPSDDSEKSAVIQRLQTAIDRQSVYERSLDTAENRLASEESALMSSERILQRIRQLAVQSNTDTLSVDDKEILANEITSLREELLSLANTQDANGNYVFAGSNVQAKAFDVNADGDIIYQGDKTQTSVDISDQRRLVLNRAGDEVFMSVDREVDGDTQNISFFKVIDDFAQALATDDEDALNLGLEEISSITERMGASIADLGSRISTVNNQREILEDTNLRYQDLLSNAQDLDYATAVTKLSAELLSLEAAQASFAKISQLSLFNYIR
jgi:flagellar hook-associated protein 3 FlgL